MREWRVSEGRLEGAKGVVRKGGGAEGGAGKEAEQQQWEGGWEVGRKGEREKGRKGERKRGREGERDGELNLEVVILFLTSSFTKFVFAKDATPFTVGQT